MATDWENFAVNVDASGKSVRRACFSVCERYLPSDDSVLEHHGASGCRAIETNAQLGDERSVGRSGARF